MFLNYVNSNSNINAKNLKSSHSFTNKEKIKYIRSAFLRQGKIFNKPHVKLKHDDGNFLQLSFTFKRGHGKSFHLHGNLQQPHGNKLHGRVRFKHAHGKSFHLHGNLQQLHGNKLHGHVILKHVHGKSLHEHGKLLQLHGKPLKLAVLIFRLG